MSINRGVYKEDAVYIHSGILLSHEKERNGVIFRKRDGPKNYHAKGSQIMRHQHKMLSLTCGT